MKLRTGLIVAAAVVVFAAVGFFAGKAWLLNHRAAPDGSPVVLEIPLGYGISGTAKLLAQAGVVDHPDLFVLAAKLLDPDLRIQAGEYELRSSQSFQSILEVLASGKVVLHPLTIPEGFNLRQIAERIGLACLADPADALNLTQNHDFIEGVGMAGVPTLEGYLFPDTYHFPKGVSAEAVLGGMVKRFAKAWKKLAPLAQQRGLSRQEAVTLASIIERETSVDGERPLISSVYHNRIKKGMLLQADPTVIYGLGEDFTGPLLHRHLELDSPYNTYLRKGLPPGPICSPGRASMAAAVNPPQTSLLYFVAKGDGSGAHFFSKTFAAHTKKVAKYRKRKAQRQ